MELLPLLLLPLLMYFLLIRPQQRKMKAQQALLSSVKEGDEVMTAGGIYGYVEAIEGDTVWLEIAEGVIMRVTKGAVARILPPGGDVPSTPPVLPPAAEEGPIVGGAPES